MAAGTATVPAIAAGRCAIVGAQSLDGWGEAEWLECNVERCTPEAGLAGKLRVTVSPKSFVSGVTDVVRVTVENTTHAALRVPLKWAAHGRFVDPGTVTFLRPDGESYDTGDGCLSLATCAELALAPGASYSWNAIAVPMKRHDVECVPLPTTPLPASRYTLRVDTHIDSDAAIWGEAPVTVSAPPPAPSP